MLEKTEGGIKNRISIDTGNFGNKIWNPQSKAQQKDELNGLCKKSDLSGIGVYSLVVIDFIHIILTLGYLFNACFREMLFTNQKQNKQTNNTFEPQNKTKTNIRQITQTNIK